jgi:hypothetical protein
MRTDINMTERHSYRGIQYSSSLNTTERPIVIEPLLVDLQF